MSETSSETTCTGYDFSDLYREEENYWWSKARRRLVSRFLRKYSPVSSPRIIDVGCGGGSFLASLKEEGSIFGLEHSVLGVSSTSAKIGGRVARGDAGSLPFKEGSFDIITSLDVIEHLDDDLAAVKGFHRVLAEGGVLILTVPALDLLWSPRDVHLGHKRRYTIKKLRLLLDNIGFEVMRCSYTNSFYFPGLLLYSIYKRFSGQTAKPGTALLSLPSWISTVFNRVLGLEEKILARTNLPIGTSMLCIARKKV